MSSISRSSASKKRKKASHDVPHLDEKWLVSYSDMMTLLFGLFVMLYSMAIEKEGVAEKVNETLSKVKLDETAKTTQQSQTATASSTPVSPSPSQAQTAPPTPSQAQAQAQAQAQITALEKVALQEWNQRVMLEKTLKQRTETLSRQVQRLHQELKIREKPSDTIKRALAAARWSAFIMASWDNPDYDIDLQVESPQKNWFGFRSPTYEGDPNSFVQDAGYGPATEVFKAQVQDKKPYQVKVSVYNFKGEPAPVEVKIKVALPNRDEIVKTISLDPTKREETFQLSLYDLLFK
ncbi:MAG: hypothetical protein KGQ59_09375 [Bdellovibrionales bacterium]|nr:hypothetical protein [Bdellovibrionales bacterium]